MAERSTLERAIQLALVAHEGQRDWNGRPFILHPMRVGMDLLPRYGEAHAAVGVLHDSIEDSEGRVTREMIEEQCGAAIADAVQVLTHLAGVTYEDYVQVVAQDQMATRVKLADLADNIHPFRLMVQNDHQAAVLVRHGKALQQLRDHATKKGWLL